MCEKKKKENKEKGKQRKKLAHILVCCDSFVKLSYDDVITPITDWIRL